MKFPVRAEPTRAGRPAAPAPRATALGGSPAGRTGRRASRAIWAPTAAGREPGPPRSRRTSRRSRRRSPARAWSGSAGGRPVSRPGARPSVAERPLQELGAGAAASPAAEAGGDRDSRSEWRRCAEPGAQASPARSGRGHLLRPLRAHVTRRPPRPPPPLPARPGASRGSEEPPPASPGAPRTRTLGLGGDPVGGVCRESPTSSRPPRLPTSRCLPAERQRWLLTSRAERERPGRLAEAEGWW